MFTQILTISKFTTIESMRNRLIWLSLLLVSLSFGLIEFIGDLAVTDHKATQVSFLAVFLRVSAVITVALFVITSMVRELQDKTLEIILAMSIQRSQYYVGKLLGYLSMALIVTIIFSLLLFLYAQPEQVIIWSISLFFELSLIVALSLVMLFTFNQIPAAFTGVLIFYFASRSLSSIYLMSQNPVFADGSIAQQFMDGFIQTLTWLLPDLDLFTQTSWLAYDTGQWSMLYFVVGQSLVYLLLLSSIALFDLYRKNF